MSEIANTNVASTGIINGCKRGDCWLSGIAHSLYACVSEQLKQQCRREGCTIKEIHELGSCNPHLHSNNTPTVLATASTELVLYARYDLVHVSEICDEETCPINHQHAVAAHTLCQNPACPIGNSHLTNTTCYNTRIKPEHKSQATTTGSASRRCHLRTGIAWPTFKANKVTLMMRIKRAIRNTWASLDIVELIAIIPLVVGASLTLLTLLTFVMIVEELAPLSLFATVFAFFCVYIPSLMANLVFWTKRLTFPGGTRFDQYVSTLSFGTALITSSLLLWASALIGIPLITLLLRQV